MVFLFDTSKRIQCRELEERKAEIIEEGRTLYDASRGSSPSYMWDEIIHPKLELEQDSRFLDVGVGEGIHLHQIPVDLDYWGLEPDVNAREAARTKAKKLKMNETQICKKGVGGIHFDRRTFQSILALCVLHEMKSSERVLAQLEDWLEPLGKLLIVERYTTIAETVSHIGRLEEFRKSMNRWLEKGGLQVTDGEFFASYFGSERCDTDPYKFHWWLGEKPEFSY